MPIYEFACGPCKTVYEEILPMGSSFDCPQCGAPAQRLVSIPAIRTDDNLTPMERTAAFMDYGRDPSSRAELNRMRYESGRPLRVGIEERAADNRKEKEPFHLTDQQRREAVAMVRGNRSRGALDGWRMEYTKNPEAIDAAAKAAQELTQNVGRDQK